MTRKFPSMIRGVAAAFCGVVVMRIILDEYDYKYGERWNPPPEDESTTENGNGVKKAQKFRFQNPPWVSKYDRRYKGKSDE
jgi:hypothetical protein